MVRKSNQKQKSAPSWWEEVQRTKDFQIQLSQLQRYVERNPQAQEARLLLIKMTK